VHSPILINGVGLIVLFNMEILLTGSNGFLARFLKLGISNCNIFNFSRNHSDYNLDLSLSIPVFRKNFDLVIHTAGKAHSIPKSQEEISSFNGINVLGTKNLVQGLNDYLPKQFVFISSVSVYGLITGENISETSPLLATDPYGKSKIEAETVVKKWCEENNVICTILRLPLVVGDNPPGNLGAMIRGIKKGYYFNIAGGTAKKSMVLASDIAKFILKAAEIGGTYNLTDGIHPTFNELSKSIAQNYNKSYVPNMPLAIANLLAKMGDTLGNAFPLNSNKLSKITSTLTFDDSKANAAFGWSPTPILESFKLQPSAQ
jgi:nucleoside-diphosphate-sugar epimerase